MAESIPIFCATDENYAPFAALMMKSVLMHTKSFVDFYVMDGGIKKKTKKLIAKDLKKYRNKKVHYVDMTKYDLSQFPDVSYFTVNMYSRFFIPLIAPALKKAIYLDVDIIVKKDISALYNEDLGPYPLGAVIEENDCNANYLRRVYPPFQGRYFNSGVLLYDIQKMREMNFVEKVIALTKEYRNRVAFPDQDILNILFMDNYKKLNEVYNINCGWIRMLKKRRPELFPIDPVVIHYVGLKPWEGHTFYFQDFEDVLKTSVFLKGIVEKYRTKKVSRYYLFGFIPLFKTSVKKELWKN